MDLQGLIVSIVMGLVFGSFATALIYRVPRDLPWAAIGRSAFRSACPSCSAALGPLDLVPVFSWLALRGKCRRCRAPVGYIYPVVELGVLLACLGVYGALGMTPAGLIVMACVPFLAALLVIDLRHMILPDHLVAIVAGLGFAHSGLLMVQGQGVQVLLLEYLGGGGIYAALIWVMGVVTARVLRREALGFGDVKFFFAAGLWLGVSNLAWFCVLSGLFGIVLGLFWQILKKERVFPFGPALIAALYVLLLLDGSLLL